MLGTEILRKFATSGIVSSSSVGADSIDIHFKEQDKIGNCDRYYLALIVSANRDQHS
jgi:hypothetical protein